MEHWNQPAMDREQSVLFCPTLNAAISPDHTVRLFEQMLASLNWSAWEARYDLRRGQPPIHPRVVAGALLYGLTLGIRTSRKLEDACRNRLDFMWLVEGRAIDHSTFANFRTRFGEELKDVFRQVIYLARGMGVARLNSVCTDGTRILACNARYNTARSGKLEEMLADVDKQVEELLKESQSEEQGEAQLLGPESTPCKLPEHLRTLEARKTRLKEAQAQLEKIQEKRGSRSDLSAKGPQIPLTDTDARVLPNKNGGYAPNYTPVVTTETQGGFIVDAEVVVGTNEEAVMVPAVDRIEEQFGEKPARLLADSGFHHGADLAALEERQVEALIPARQEFANNPAPRPDPTVAVEESRWVSLPICPQSKKLDKAAFIYHQELDTYYCPMGRTLTFRGGRAYRRDTCEGMYRLYETDSCEGCPLASRCLRDNQKRRVIFRDEYEGVRERTAERFKTPAGKAAYGKRMPVSESTFGILKQAMNFRQFLLRGIDKVRTEFRWAATAFNLAKLVRCKVALRAALAGNGGAG